MVNMICKFCLHQVAALVRAHVIPEFLMKASYDAGDKNHRGLVLTGDISGLVGENLQQKRVLGQDVDGNLTCQACEVLFNSWERPASRILGPASPAKFVVKAGVAPNGNVLRWEEAHNFDYATLKLFVLSMVWRLDASDIALASRVRIGTHADRIKAMLSATDPGSDFEYPIVISRIRLKGEPLGYCEAYSSKIDDHWCVFIFAGGFRFLVFTSSHRIPKSFAHMSLKKDGTACISIEDARDQRQLMSYIKQGRRSFGRIRIEVPTAPPSGSSLASPAGRARAP
jgi:hypothetical protein